MCSTSIEKYLAAKTDYDATTIDVDEIQYPSISVCRKYAMDNIDAFPKLLTNDSLTSKKKLVFENIWGKDDVFHFVSHPGIFGLKCPCLTTNEGTDPGKPC